MFLSKKLLLTSFFIVLFILGLISKAQVKAAVPCDPRTDPDKCDPYGLRYGEASGLSPDDPRTIVANIINVALSILGIIATCLILYAGFKWMTAGGAEEGVADAKKILWASVVGLLIILSAYSISKFVFGRLSEATGSTGVPTNVQ